MIRHHIFIGLLACTLGALLAVPVIPDAGAQGLRDRRPPDDSGVEPGGYSLDDAVALAQSRFRARVVKAETVAEDGRRVHHIRLLNDQGRVWTVRIDAATGRLQ